MTDRYQQLIEAVEWERKIEEKFFLDALAAKTTKQKVSLGFAWHPCRIVSMVYTIGENVEVELERIRDINYNHKLKTGVGIKLTANYKNEEIEFQGSISFLRKNKVKIILRSDVISKDSLPDNINYCLEMVYDERPYTIMKDSLKNVMASKDEYLVALREGIRKQSSFDYAVAHELKYDHKNLNPSQLLAVENCLTSQHLSIIHGPPGTGKTTTLVALIKELVSVEKRVLVCASSNNAVDLLTILLHNAGLDVLRIGNVTRIDDNITHLTIDEKARDHKEWQRIKKIRIEADEAQRMAGQHKRVFSQEQRDERRDMYAEARELRKWARSLEERLTSEIVEQAQVVLTTLISSTSYVISGLKFKTCVIDEASQCLEPEFWTAVLKAEKVVLAGDHKQLPPTIKSTEAASMGLNLTVLDHMADYARFSTLLNVQYRMNEHLLGFPNKKFYGNNLNSSDLVAKRLLPNDTKPLVFIDTAGTGFEEKFNPEYKSLSNEGEFFIIREHIIQNLENLLGRSIGIITPYAEQVRLISSKWQEEETLRSLDVHIDSIDGFQGQEKDIIYISLVRSNDRGEIGFLVDERRLNVALTRARMKLIIIGDGSTIGNNALYNELIDHVDAQGHYMSAWEYMQ